MGKFNRHKIFKSGVHKNTGEQVWPPERVRGILDSTQKNSPELIPYTLLHPENSLPIYGFCRREDIKGTEVSGGFELSAIPTRFAEAAIPSLIKAGLNQISIGLGRLDEIVHIGFVPAPAVEGLGHVFSATPITVSSVAEVLFSAEELGGAVNMFSVSWEWDLRYKLSQIGQAFRALRDREIAEKGLESADKFLPSYLVDSIATELPPDVPDSNCDGGQCGDGSGDTLKVGFVAGGSNSENAALELLMVENARLKSETAAALSKAAELELLARKAEVTGFLDTITDRVPPSIRQVFENILFDLQGVGPRTFASADGTAVERTSFDALKELLVSAPVQVSFGLVDYGDLSGSTNETLEDVLQRQYDAAQQNG